MKQYKEMVRTVLEKGIVSKDRTGVGTIRIPSYNVKFDLSDGTVPIVTGKRTATKTLGKELLWFLNGEQNLKTLLEQSVHIWTEWKFERYIEGKCPENERYIGPKFPENWKTLKNSDKEFRKFYDEQIKIFEQKILNGEITSKELTIYDGIYGHAWKYTPVIEEGKVVRYKDQLNEVQELVKQHSTSRRILLISYDSGRVDNVDLPPCVYAIQIDIIEDVLHMIVNQRSADTFLGVPFDLAEYGILLHILAGIGGLKSGTLTYNFGDTHIYLNHIEKAKEYLEREIYDLPTIKFNRDIKSEDIRNIKLDDFEIVNYKCGEPIKADIAI